MSEKSKDALARRIAEHAAASGKLPSAADAHRQAADVARRRDAERSEGAAKNTRKRAKEADSRASDKPTGRIVIDYGKGK